MKFSRGIRRDTQNTHTQYTRKTHTYTVDYKVEKYMNFKCIYDILRNPMLLICPMTKNIFKKNW